MFSKEKNSNLILTRLYDPFFFLIWRTQGTQVNETHIRITAEVAMWPRVA